MRRISFSASSSATLRRSRRHHLRLAGRDDPLFSDDAAPAIHQSSCGHPRAVNNLAIQALIAVFTDGKAIVDECSTCAAISEVMTE
ncbi:hypothetical protein [Dactylosporangium sp. NPDC051484]|uniref:hypothetical protein n=1 Tax=Dactylosporangium sp. NPDC051484 TaxID=3154942 RepID=UPI003450FD5B